MAEGYLLRRQGGHWSIAAGGVAFFVADIKGMDYLARLIRTPGKGYHALDLHSPDKSLPRAETEAAAEESREAERARVTVTKRIKSAIRRIQEFDAVLGHHLLQSVKTGRVCVYDPGPRPMVKCALEPS